MVKLLRRFVVLAALMFWQGGFMFYGGVVGPIGADVLCSPLSQGFFTREVTNYLNLAGVAALPLLVWDMMVSMDDHLWRRRLRWALWGILAATLAGLCWLHVRLDDLLDAEQLRILDQQAYRGLHQVYLAV